MTQAPHPTGESRTAGTKQGVIEQKMCIFSPSSHIHRRREICMLSPHKGAGRRAKVGGSFSEPLAKANRYYFKWHKNGGQYIWFLLLHHSGISFFFFFFPVSSRAAREKIGRLSSANIALVLGGKQFSLWHTSGLHNRPACKICENPTRSTSRPQSEK